MMDDIMGWKPKSPLTFKLLFAIALCIGVLAAIPGFIDGDTDVVVPEAGLPAYHPLHEEDFTVKKIKNYDVTQNAVMGISEIAGNGRANYSLVPLSADKPFTRDLIREFPEGLDVNDSCLMSIAATPALALGGRLQAGDKVDIIAVKSVEGRAVKSTIFKDIYLLDVQMISNLTKSENESSGNSLLAIAAVPLNQSLELAENISDSKVFILRRV